MYTNCVRSQKEETACFLMWGTLTFAIAQGIKSADDPSVCLDTNRQTKRQTGKKSQTLRACFDSNYSFICTVEESHYWCYHSLDVHRRMLVDSRLLPKAVSCPSMESCAVPHLTPTPSLFFPGGGGGGGRGGG